MVLGGGIWIGQAVVLRRHIYVQHPFIHTHIHTHSVTHSLIHTKRAGDRDQEGRLPVQNRLGRLHRCQGTFLRTCACLRPMPLACSHHSSFDTYARACGLTHASMPLPARPLYSSHLPPHRYAPIQPFYPHLLRLHAHRCSHCLSPPYPPTQVTRDRVVSRWTWEESFPHSPPPTDFGSGYPSDPRTADWLAAHTDAVFGFPSLIRFSWSTAREKMEKACVPVAWAHEEDEDEGALPPGTASIEAFIKRPSAAVASAAGAGQGKRARKRARYFSRRHVEVVGSF